ncbi:hypothetical protein JCM8208_001380 [Rhodotorula glutinis]
MPSKHKGRRRPPKAPPRPPPRRKTTRCILPTLPPDLLVRIFRLDRAISFDNFLLSKALLPHTLAALACGVDLLYIDAFISFCFTLRRHPFLVDAVERLQLTFTSGFFPPDDDDDDDGDEDSDSAVDGASDGDEWVEDPERESAGQLGRNREDLEARKDPDDDELCFGPSLVQDLCRLLHRVTELRVCGVQAYRDLFDAPFLDERPFPRLRHLELFARSRTVDRHVFAPQDAALFAHLRLIPTLRTVVLESADAAALSDSALALAIGGGGAYLAPRTLYLAGVHLDNFARVGGAGARMLWSALRPGLASVRISAREVYERVVDDLVRLPSTVTSLELVVGDDCPHYVASSSSPPRALDSTDLARALPYLHHLHLSGPLVSPSTFPLVIHHLPLLSCLRLGPHTAVPGAHLTSLLRGGPPSWPDITTLTLTLCTCDPPSPPSALDDDDDDDDLAARRRTLGHARIASHAACTCVTCPREPERRARAPSKSKSGPVWPEGLSAQDVREVWHVARTRGIDVFGNARCAAGTRCILPTLPPDLLLRIFQLDRAITLDNAVLSKALLPHTLGALASCVALSSLTRLSSFCCALERRPFLADAVEDIGLYVATPQDVDSEVEWWLPASSTIGAGQLAKDRKELESRKKRPNAPERLIVGPGLLRDLFRLLPRVRFLTVVGLEVYRILLARTYLDERPFPRLDSLVLDVDADLLGEDLRQPDDDALFANLALIPTLRCVILETSAHDLAVSSFNLAAGTYLAPRSLYLPTLRVLDFGRIGPEASTLFSALRPGLVRFTISCQSFYKGFDEDLVRLPPTVVNLSLTVGLPCPFYFAPAVAPKVDNPLLPLALPNLRHLRLSGPLVSPSTFPNVIEHLADLRTLAFGTHTDLDAAQLLAYLRRRTSPASSALPAFTALQIDVCRCDPATDTLALDPGLVRRSAALDYHGQGTQFKVARAPNWPAGLGKDDAREIVRVCGGAGSKGAREVQLSGSVVCALKGCGGDGFAGHRCPEGWP